MSYLNSITALSLQIFVLSTTAWGTGMVQMPWESFGENPINYAGQYYLAAKDHTHTLTINEIKSTNLQSEDNFYVTDINLAGCNGADELIEKIIKSSYLSSLLRINLSNSDVSLEGLNNLKSLSPKKGIVRPFLKASARFGMQVAVIEVDVSGTDIAKKYAWELNNKISVPTEEVINVTYLDNGETDSVHLQILPRF